MKIQFFLCVALFCAVFVTTPGCSDDLGSETVVLSPDGKSLEGRASNEPVRRAYRDKFDTWYQYYAEYPASPFPFPGWYPGGGEGNATHIGKANTFFNQYVTVIDGSVVSLHAPVTQYFEAQLAAAGYTGIPDEVGSIVYDDKGNSIWFHATSNTSIPVSDTRIEFSGVNQIVGGTGKFEGATGEVSLNGYYNPQDQQDAGFWQEGWIEY